VNPEPCAPCPPACRSVFDRVVVRHTIRGGTWVGWTLLPTFTDPAPLTFQLEVGTTANPDADNWKPVGTPVVNQYSKIDPDQHVWGKTNWTHYRVKLTTSLGVYYSEPTGGMGILHRRDWLLARELVRQRLVYYRKGRSAQRGFLFKRRWGGPRCPVCTDMQTQEPRNPDCPTCYGTGFQCGFYYPQACVWASLSPKQRRTQLDGGQARGTVDDIVVQADMLLTDLLSEGDLFVVEQTDDRYYVRQVQHTAEVRGVPIAGNVELRLIPFSSILYTLPIPDALRQFGDF
jgi:hypothetical protein